MEVRSYLPTGKQQGFHASSAKYRLILGAYGAGKTTMAVWEDIMSALEHPNSVGVVFRRTFPALRDTTLRQYLEHCPTELIKEFKQTEGREQLEFPNGAITRFRCLDDYLKLGSSQYDRITIDEASEIPEREFRALAFGRLRGTVGPRRMVVATNPVDDTHWLYKFFVEEADEEKEVFHFSTYDNAKNLPPGYISRLEKMRPQEQRMYLFGEWGVLADGAPVFPMFNEAAHVADLSPIKGHLCLRGWDPGFSHPACIWLQRDVMGHWAVLHELGGDNEDVTSFARRCIDDSFRLFGDDTPFEDYCDIAGTQRHDTGPTFVHQLRNKFGLICHTRRIELERSIQLVRDYLGELGNNGIPMLRVDRKCRKVWKALAGGYHINVRTGEPQKDGVYDHYVDALRYALVPAVRADPHPKNRPLPKSWRIAV